MSTENLKLADAIPDSCVLVVYPRPNQGKWAFSLHKFSTQSGLHGGYGNSMCDRKKYHQKSNFSNSKKTNKPRNNNLLEEVNNQKQAENLIKMKTFYNIKYKVYPHNRLATSKGVVRSRELSLVTPKKIKTALEKQGLADYKSRRVSEEIETHTYIF